MLYGTVARCNRLPPFTERQPGVRQMHIFGARRVRYRDLGRLPDLGPDQDHIVGNRSTFICLRSGGLGMPDLHTKTPNMIAEGISDAKAPMQKRYIFHPRRRHHYHR
jgi:hypothetical protein